MSEKHECPVRKTTTQEANPDEWSPGAERWRLNDENIVWPGHYDLPRWCSYCCGIHPEDALDLLEQGWESSSTSEEKRFLYPPGFLHRLKGVAKPDSPIPPVKLYVKHMSDEHAVRYNVLIQLSDQP